uniref:Mediator of RNA polymerase II transcription subunit 11 n=1 Tax=Elaeophora elaphi TaxID=1147741 RepID=A0A0R3S154_9BILA
MSNLSSSSGSELAWRLKAIGDVEQKIAELIKHAQTCVSELSKEKQASIVYISKSKMEEASSAFKKCLNSIESDLNAQMQYLSHVCVGTAHQGSTFASQQNIALAEQTLVSLRDRLSAIQQTYLPVMTDISAIR